MVIWDHQQDKIKLTKSVSSSFPLYSFIFLTIQ